MAEISDDAPTFTSDLSILLNNIITYCKSTSQGILSMNFQRHKLQKKKNFIRTDGLAFLRMSNYFASVKLFYACMEKCLP